VEGALWRARLAEANGAGRRLERGSRVRVESVEGLTLQVRPLTHSTEEAAQPSAVERQ
jgi:membrane protein implicated in regulation of membrane protease activity